MKCAPDNVRYLGQSGEHILPASFTARDPKPTVGHFTDDRLLPGGSDRAGVNGYPIPEEMFEDMRSSGTEVLGLPGVLLIVVLRRQFAGAPLDHRLENGT